MSEEFDAYYKWLGIPPDEQPPHHYRLLRLSVFESDKDVIDLAYEKEMFGLKRQEHGEHVDSVEKLGRELLKARNCLLNDEAKADYDARLRASQPYKSQEPERPDAAHFHAQRTEEQRMILEEWNPPVRFSSLPWLVGGGVVAASLILISAVLLLSGDSEKESTPSSGESAGEVQPAPVQNESVEKKIGSESKRSETEFVGLRNVITSIPETVQQAINTASVALTKWDPDDDDLDTDAFRKDAREAVTALGEHICYADQTDELIKPMMVESIELLQDLRGKQKKLEIVNSWAADRLKQEISDPVGILMIGEVKAIESRGSLFETRLELITEESESITVLTKSDPSGFSPPGAKVIVIGVLVNEPTENFSGYGGDEPQVVAAGTLTLLEPLSSYKSSN